MMFFGSKGKKLAICGQKLGKQVSDFKSTPSKKGTSEILLRLES